MAQSVLQKISGTFSVVGLSLGGIISLEIVKQAPERINKLALFDTNPFPAREEQIKMWQHHIEMAHNNDFTSITSQYLLPGLLREKNQNNQRLIDVVYSMADHVGPKAMENQLYALMNRPDATEHLYDITCSTLIAMGREDNVCSIDMHRFMRERIPHAAFVVIEEAGHLSSIEQPQAVTALLRYWLDLTEV